MYLTTSPRIAHLTQLRDAALALGYADLATCWDVLIKAEQMAPELAPNGEGDLGPLTVRCQEPEPESYNAPFQDDLEDGPQPDQQIVEEWLNGRDLEAEKDEAEPGEWATYEPTDRDLGIR